MKMKIGIWLALVALIGFPLSLTACGMNAGTASEGSVAEKAAIEATAIIQQAEATALVLRAQAEATALIQSAVPIQITPKPTEAFPISTQALMSIETEEIESTTTSNLNPSSSQPTETASTSESEVSNTVELLGVSFAADGGLIMVSFKAQPRVVSTWNQGMVSVEDEATGIIYNEIPVVPVIGPLIGRPIESGQIGYVMLVNQPPDLKSGALVTVVLGDYKFEHIMVQ